MRDQISVVSYFIWVVFFSISFISVDQMQCIFFNFL